LRPRKKMMNRWYSSTGGINIHAKNAVFEPCVQNVKWFITGRITQPCDPDSVSYTRIFALVKTLRCLTIYNISNYYLSFTVVSAEE
jgi:hypothetical protein